MNDSQTCDGIRRRDFVAWGVLGAGQLTLPAVLRAEQTGQTDRAGASAGIFVFLGGGPSHLDTFDLKPRAPAEYRGSFQPIATNVPGFQICEHLPNLAQCADKYAILRGGSHTFAAHDLGSTYLSTGTRPLATLAYPAYGSVVAKERPSQQSVPSYVAIPNAPRGAGFLGPRYTAFDTGTLPGRNRQIELRGIQLPNHLPLDEFQRRHELLRNLDRQFEAIDGNHGLLDALDKFTQQAFDIIRSTRTREAFELAREAPSFARRFGTGQFGQACLLAIRLIEAGVRFVSITSGGWDTHAGNFPTLKNRLLPSLDVGLSGLLTGLDERGLLPSTAVYVTGEFGRTPKINDRQPSPGRDHYPRCMCMLMAGGRVRGGQVVGESDRIGSEPASVSYSPDDAAATFYANLGIDPKQQYSASGRPITLVRDGGVIGEFFG